ncbi:hypothetical protein JTE90_026971 [Oedothorax gibbosus]|uniref:Uncharacterized protein n=1 Tax=Oedothorax gibbosus TaxID=931172 RepID=A0AAV6TD55_9ARAC|nr:hypothetical protein JTE90_026971 [Oedothorax gibbosus]
MKSYRPAEVGPHSGSPPVPSRRGRTGGPPVPLVEEAEFERTRVDPKEVKLGPRPGRGQRKLWWRSLAVLTAKRSSDLGS